MDAPETLRTTPLTAWHRENGAKMASFAGFDMPIQYTGILAEHSHTRSKAAVFDISHMGEFLLSGAGALEGLNALVTQDLNTLAPGKCRYGFLLHAEGGVLDDLIIYCLAENTYMLVVNGACEEKDFSWIASHLPTGPALRNISADTAKIDLQGPESLDVLEKVLGTPWRHLKYFNHEPSEWNGGPLRVSRTGYTGELGYELYLPAEQALPLWLALVADERVQPVGLGARDTLRLECGYPLYGQDLDEAHTPEEAGYGFLLTKQADFMGKSSLGTPRQHLVPLSIEGRRSARHNDKLLNTAGQPVGLVTSGSFSPTLGHGIALAWINAGHENETDFLVEGARTNLPAKRAELPFFKGGTARMKLE
ncbi:MAG: glycine cleavage system aminomethyltransferase GcvT [Desulfovibrio sp.]